MAEEEEILLVNRILVLVTFSIMVLSIISCVIMYIFRDYRKKEVTSNQPARRRNDSTRSMDGPEPSYQSGSFVRKNSSSGKADSTSSGDNKILGKIAEEDVESEPLISRQPSALSSNLAGEDDIVEKRNLNESIEVALNVGVTLTLHTVKSSRSARISLLEGVLTCRVRKSMSVKVVQIGLKEIKSIVSGKSTPNFKQAHLQTIAEDVCFSIITGNKTLDFEAMYKTERDALVAGLQILLNRYKESHFDNV